MSDIIEEKDKILSFTLFRVEKGREKLCKCNPPHYEVDTVNRIVTCKDCGATIDSFDALVTLCKYMKRYEEYQREAIEKTKAYREMAESEWNRKMKNQAFKEMDSTYQKGFYPICPKCGEVFDPMKIGQWVNKKLCEGD